MMLAAKYADWWNIPDANFADYKAKVRVLHRHCQTIGRDPETIRLAWFGRLVVGKTQDEALKRGGSRWTPQNAFVGTTAQILEQLQQFVDIGTDYFMVEVPDIDQPDVQDMLFEDVLPKLV